MESASDTIIAPATPPGVAALALIRISGPQSLKLLQQLTSKKSPWIARQACHVVLKQNGVVLDNVIATWWQNPVSFTGEDVVEITCHGNPRIVENILKAFIVLGARMARPGEFTERAFLNGKMDLTQAESILDLLHAGTERALDNARKIHDGKLGAKLLEIRSGLIDQLAHLEAYIDFPEEDINPETGTAFIKSVEAIQNEIQSLMATAPAGRILREGIRTAIVGRPNVGKSSLLNALLREKRAIVSPTPGTTRDTIEAECEVKGLRLILIDTAGQRKTDDAIESEGIERAQKALRSAQLVLHLIEAPQSKATQQIDLSMLSPEVHLITIATKSDLGIHADNQGLPAISLLNGDGLSALEAVIESQLLKDAPVEQPGWIAVNARQEAALKQSFASLSNALAGLKSAIAPELVSIELRAALQHVGEVIGLADNEDILDALFAKFCLGK